MDRNASSPAGSIHGRRSPPASVVNRCTSARSRARRRPRRNAPCAHTSRPAPGKRAIPCRSTCTAPGASPQDAVLALHTSPQNRSSTRLVMTIAPLRQRRCRPSLAPPSTKLAHLAEFSRLNPPQAHSPSLRNRFAIALPSCRRPRRPRFAAGAAQRGSRTSSASLGHFVITLMALLRHDHL